jgi:hypothetical protein
MSEPIYIVIGDHGSYSDASQWDVCWYDNRADAQAHVDRAQQRGNELSNQLRGRPYLPNERLNEHDPWWQGVGTDYTVTELWHGDDLKKRGMGP